MAQQHYSNNSRNFFISLSLIFTNFNVLYNYKNWFYCKENLYLCHYQEKKPKLYISFPQFTFKA